MPSTPFGATRDGEPLTSYHLSKAINTGIAYAPLLPGFVPEIEEREACRFGGYTWREWQELPRYDRVDGVAHFRLARLIDLHQSDALSRHQEREVRRRGA